MPRPKGSRNIKTLEVRELARDYGPQAIKRLAQLAGLVDPEQASPNHAVQVMAMRELLDRAYGKPKVFLESENGNAVINVIERVIVAQPESRAIEPLEIVDVTPRRQLRQREIDLSHLNGSDH